MLMIFPVIQQDCLRHESRLSFDKLLQQVSSLIRQPNFRVLWVKQPEYPYTTKKQDRHSLSKKKGRER